MLRVQNPAAWGRRSPARQRRRESSSVPRGRKPLFGALITRERLPRALRGAPEQAAASLKGAVARGCPPNHSRLHPPRTANGAQPARGLSGVSRPEPISVLSAFPKSCKQPPWPVLGRSGRLGRAGAMAGGGVTHPTGLCFRCGCLGNWARVGAFHQ